MCTVVLFYFSSLPPSWHLNIINRLLKIKNLCFLRGADLDASGHCWLTWRYALLPIAESIAFSSYNCEHWTECLHRKRIYIRKSPVSKTYCFIDGFLLSLIFIFLLLLASYLTFVRAFSHLQHFPFYILCKKIISYSINFTLQSRLWFWHVSNIIIQVHKLIFQSTRTRSGYL